MCLIFGTTFLAIKIGLEAGWAPYFSAGFRFFIAGLLVVLYGTVTKQFRIPTKKNIVEFLITGACMTGITFGTLYWAEQHIPSSFAALLSATGPLFVSLFHSIMEKVKITKAQFVGLVLGFLGIGLITGPSLSVQFHLLWFIACFVIIIGESFYAFGTIYSKMVLKQGISPLMLNGYQMLFGGLLLIILSFAFERPSFSGISYSGWISLLYLIVIGSVLGHGLYYWLIKKTNPAFPSTWLYVSPFISLMLDLWIKKETFHPVSIIGGFVILAGVYLMNSHILRESFTKKTKSVSS
ncbi:drug/metabolite transporter (DMT)-like permease [Anoxybacillus vitaminiphilus]|uniref:Drug/metabolite transporter (DMT)-like permease n=1 Tax=Paranoxybacillus vitaminiphilus TaxID=581036 RepID=A0A327YSY6_9BACL|nr:EamA family transporter [Anoxybacillus vitaminiphilus]RAK23466.1 drug/metabolite transporter (DMT)-like permease [Anoxybacillus vitaminiphilus]